MNNCIILGQGKSVFSAGIVVALSVLLCLHPVTVSSADQAIQDELHTFFEAKIRPVLLNSCFRCHGGEEVNNGLRVISREALLEGGINGPTIVPGQPDASLLIEAIRYDDAAYVQMPPDEKLPNHVVADFEDWVRRGAFWPAESAWQAEVAEPSAPHWSFVPVKPFEPPVPSTAWSNHPIDRFISAEWRAHELSPNPSADKRTLIRRVCFDLIGLPPAPEAVSAFVNDTSPDAFGNLVENLLASPRYGERWGRHWMDVVRYADTAGDNADYPIPEIHHYRDYIIDAFNADKPYNQFIQEQLAGDILAKEGAPERFAEQVIATGFVALSRRYGTAPYELRHLIIEDTIESMGRAFIGLTLRCARCHDHKFDPVTMEDYYALYGIFASTQYPYTGSEIFRFGSERRMNFVPLLPPEQTQPIVDSHRKQLAQIQVEIDQLERESLLAKKRDELNLLVESVGKEIAALMETGKDIKAIESQNQMLTERRDRVKGQINKKKEELKQQLARSDLPGDLPQAYAVQDGPPVDVPIQLRGNPRESGPVAMRNTPRFLSGNRSLDIPSGQSGRLQLAEWLTDRANPLTARVMVNRIWQYHFGKGIVSTPSNFGRSGAMPTHPKLLDNLAERFVESGWSIKAMHRLILSSKTYQLASDYNAQNASKDPANAYYWRFDRRRLEAEAIRDAMMVASGMLRLNRPGGHPFPPVSTWRWTQHFPFKKKTYSSNHRSVYLMTQRLQRHPFLGLFDGPDTNTTTGKRMHSTVPQQSLFLRNHPWVQEQAEAFANRLIESSKDFAQRVNRAHQFAYGREAYTHEQQRATEYIAQVSQELNAYGMSSEQRELETWASYARVVLTANEFLYID